MKLRIFSSVILSASFLCLSPGAGASCLRDALPHGPKAAGTFVIDRVTRENSQYDFFKPVQVAGAAVASEAEKQAVREAYLNEIQRFEDFCLNADSVTLDAGYREASNGVTRAASRFLEINGVAHEIDATQGVKPMLEGQPFALELKITAQGRTRLNRLQRGMQPKYRTSLRYSNEEMGRYTGLFVTEPDLEGDTAIYLGDKAILKLSPHEDTVVHEFTHAKNWSGIYAKRESPFYGDAKPLAEHGALPGVGDAYSDYMSFDEVEAYRRGLDVEIKKILARAEGENVRRTEGIAELKRTIPFFEEVTERSALIAELCDAVVDKAAVGSKKFEVTVGGVLYEASIAFDDYDGFVDATVKLKPQSPARGKAKPAQGFMVRVPLIHSAGLKDPQNLRLLQNQIGSLREAAGAQIPVAQKWLRQSFDLQPGMNASTAVDVLNGMRKGNVPILPARVKVR